MFQDDVQIDDRDDDQYEKILSYDYKYAAPVASSELEDKVPIPHTDYNFDEKDYRRKLAFFSFVLCDTTA